MFKKTIVAAVTLLALACSAPATEVVRPNVTPTPTNPPVYVEVTASPAPTTIPGSNHTATATNPTVFVEVTATPTPPDLIYTTEVEQLIEQAKHATTEFETLNSQRRYSDWRTDPGWHSRMHLVAEQMIQVPDKYSRMTHTLQLTNVHNALQPTVLEYGEAGDKLLYTLNLLAQEPYDAMIAKRLSATRIRLERIGKDIDRASTMIYEYYVDLSPGIEPYSSILRHKLELTAVAMNEKRSQFGLATLTPVGRPAITGSAGSTEFRNGVFQIGTDIAPGTYRAPGSDRCYWARLSNFTGTSNILANHFGPGQVIVTIERTDVGFESSNCGRWTRIGN